MAMTLLPLLLTAVVPRVEIAPGVHMPLINFGVQKNHSLAVALGGYGLDTANVYGDAQQRDVGAAVRQAVARGIPRSELFVTSKIECCPGSEFMGPTAPFVCLGKKDPASDLKHNFDVLGLTYVDLMLLHWPCDELEGSVAAYKAMQALLPSGRVKAIGVSNFNASALAALMSRISVKPAVNQCGYSIAGHTDRLWGRDDATRTACEAANITYSAYSPLGGYVKGGTSHVLDDATVGAVAKVHNTSTAAVALRWVTQQGIVAVTSSDKASHILGDLASFDLELTEDEMAKLATVV
uniref:NADP-dependent oxidoreductase domain-containing protein n=1 Tax=Calcidiscus leptoporus TaxID=127549 RepID=A0A7S0J8M2_9EUKA|mmetsp:Transcript_44717/g.104439  ORF Transcript_44717/g.104439 Transcript_44717/m.104439 type:complete len:295 (+) Transcript_44717:99-983(+)